MYMKKHTNLHTAPFKAIAIASLTGFLLTACQSAPEIDPKVISDANSANAVLFNATAKTSGATEASIVAALNNDLAGAYSAGDTGKVSSLLASGFVKRSLLGENELVEQNSSDIANAIKMNPAKLTYAVQSIKLAEDQKSAAVVALATYESKHFSPKFVESLIFTNQDGSWKLANQSAAPLHPSLPQLHKTKVIVTEKFWSDDEAKSLAEVYTKKAQEVGAEAALDYVQSNIKARTGDSVHALIVFNEPPKVGSTIKVGADFHHYGRVYPYTQTYSVDTTYRNYVVGIETLAHPKIDDIGFQIYVDGALVSKTISKGQ